jgi:hypothetical protein
MHRLWLLALFGAGCPDDPSPATDAGTDSGVALPDAPPDAAARCPANTVVNLATSAELAVAGDTGSAMGIFDPSIVYPAGANAGALAYSSVPNQETIRTRIAVSNNAGTTWTFVAEANVPEPATLPSSDATECPGGACTGNLISEVSSLIIDPLEPNAQRRWKLFAHRYLVGPGVNLHYRIGTIAMQTAPAPNGPWSAPQKLIGWNSPAPYSSTGVVTNASALAGTADCLALTEPTALVLPQSIELAVGCVYLAAGVPKIRIELLRSVDHAASWLSVGTLLRADDASCLTQDASVNAAELFVSGGNIYVAASPSNNAGYHGCVVIPVEDIAQARIRRDPSGAALPSRLIVPSETRFSGACSFGEAGGGFALSVGYLEAPRKFRMVRTAIATP